MSFEDAVGTILPIPTDTPGNRVPGIDISGGKFSPFDYLDDDNDVADNGDDGDGGDGKSNIGCHAHQKDASKFMRHVHYAVCGGQGKKSDSPTGKDQREIHSRSFQISMY